MLLYEFHHREALERMRTIQLDIKRESQVGRHGGSGKWPVRIVLLICEILVNGKPSSAVPANIQTVSVEFTGTAACEIPSVEFVSKCQVVLQIVNETLSAFILGNAETWNQLFKDGTSRRQISLQNLVIYLMENDGLDPVIVSSCMYVEDETSEKCVESILETVSYILCHEYLFVYDSSLTKVSDIISVTIQLTKLKHHLQQLEKSYRKRVP